MIRLQAIRTRFHLLLAGRAVESRMNEEFSLHIEMEAERLIAEEGLGAAEARRRALVAFGSVERHKDEIRNGRGLQLAEDLVADARFAFRTMRRAPALSATIVLTLAIAIGSTVGVFGLLYTVLLQRLPLPDPSELYAIQPMNGGRIDFIDAQELRTLQQTGRMPASAGQHFSAVTIGSEEGQEDVFADFVTPGYFDVLRAAPALGRTFAADGSEDAAPVTVISNEVWRRHFGSDPGVIGKSLRVGIGSLVVIGVMPDWYEGIHFARRFTLAIPFGTGPLVGVENAAYGLQLVARVAPGAVKDLEGTLTQTYRECCGPYTGVRSGAVRASSNRPQARPSIYEAPTAATSITTPDVLPHVQLTDASRGLTWSAWQGLDFRSTYGWLLAALMVGVLILLVGACSNVGALLLARSAAREREFGIRLSIGAGSSRITRQLLTESLLLAGLGSILGCGLAWIGIDLLIDHLPQGAERLGRIIEWRPSPVLLAFTTAVMILATLLFGTLPAWTAGRTDPRVPMTGSGAGGGRAGMVRTAAGLVSVQIAIGIVLIVGASIFAGTIRNLNIHDRAFDADHLLFVQFDAQGAPATDPAQLMRLLDEGLPGHSGIAVMLDAPLVEDLIQANRPRIPGASAPDEDVVLRSNAVSSGYFSVIGIDRLQGREFDERDNSGAPKVAVVSRSFARLYFGNTPAVGQTLLVPTAEGEEETTVVGVVEDIPYDDPRTPPPPTWYRAILQLDYPVRSPSLLIRSTGDPADLINPVRTVLTHAIPGATVSRIRPLQSMVDDTLTRERLAAALSVCFGGAAALLVAVGVYGLLNNLIGRRRRELGVRIAIGANPASVVGILVRQSVSLIAAGILMGVPLAILVSNLVRSQVYGIDPADPQFILQGGLGILAVVIGATIAPGLRLLKLDPASVMRGD